MPAIRSSTASRAVRNSTHTSGACGAQRAQDLQAVDVGQHPVQHHRVGPEVAAGASAVRAVGRDADLPALVAQRAGEHVGEVGFVVDDEDADAACRRVGAAPACRREARAMALPASPRAGARSRQYPTQL